MHRQIYKYKLLHLLTHLPSCRKHDADKPPNFIVFMGSELVHHAGAFLYMYNICNYRYFKVPVMFVLSCLQFVYIVLSNCRLLST